jgi:hypothetical protein
MCCLPSSMDAICFAPASTESNSPPHRPERLRPLLQASPLHVLSCDETSPAGLCDQRRIVSISIRSFEKEPVIVNPHLMKGFAIFP